MVLFFVVVAIVVFAFHSFSPRKFKFVVVPCAIDITLHLSGLREKLEGQRKANRGKQRVKDSNRVG